MVLATPQPGRRRDRGRDPAPSPNPPQGEHVAAPGDHVAAWLALAAGRPPGTDLDPLGTIFRDATRDAVAPQLAIQRARAVGDAALDGAFVASAATAATTFASEGRIRHAAALSGLLLAAVEGAGIAEEDLRWADAVHAEVVVFAVVVSYEPSLDVFRRVERHGERLVAQERRRAETTQGDQHAQAVGRWGRALLGLGLLRGSIAAPPALDGPTHPLGGPPGAYGLLEHAVADLEQALPLLRQTDDTITCLTQLAALHERFAGRVGAASRTRAVELYRRLHDLTSPERYPDSHYRALTNLLALGVVAPMSVGVAGHAIRPLDDGRTNLATRVELAFLRLSTVLRTSGSRSAHRVWLDVAEDIPLDDLRGHEREEWLGHLPHVLDPGAFRCTGPASVQVGSAAEVEARTRRWLARLIADGEAATEGGAAACRRLAILHGAGHLADPEAALELVSSLVPDATWSAPHRLARTALLAGVAHAAALARLGEGRLDSALHADARSLGAALDAGLGSGVVTVLDALRVVAADADAEPDAAFDAIATVLGTASARADASPDDAVRTALHELGRLTAPLTFGAPGGDVARWRDADHRWLFKAPLLGARALATEPVTVDGAALRALEAAQAQERESTERDTSAGADGVARRDARFVADAAVNAELLRLARLQPSERRAGDTPAEQLANLRSTFEHELRARRGVARDVGRPGEPTSIADAWSRAASGRTAVVDLSFGVDDGRSLLITTVWHTSARHGRRSVARATPMADVEELVADDGIGTLPVAPVAHRVAALRDQLQVPSRLRSQYLPAGARDLAAALGADLLGGVADFLDELATEGVDHLAVVPTGPFFFAPLHLLMVEPGGVLADRFAVSVVPSPRLVPRRDRGASGVGTVVASSPDGGVAHGLPVIPELAAQVAQVLRATGGSELAPVDATPDAVLAAAERCRHLHLAAHGADYPPAPSFQCLYLAPGASGEGRLFAYQVLQHDLSGVELVTLSACETALGRVDLDDDLDGIVGAFLAAGARAVVAALWQVEVGASTAFFGHLYAGLADGHPPFDAYRLAQVRTRATHPHHRHWGAFAFFGDWRAGKDT